MANAAKANPGPVLFGGFVVFLIICVGAYLVLRPGENEPAASPTYPGEPVSGEAVKTASGLTYYDLKVGDGPSPGRTATVQANYTGWLLSGKKFDSSADHGGPQPFSLTGVIPGWTEGVGSMKVGGKRKLIVPPHLGYGQRPPSRDIPPGATLVFDIELVEIVGPK